MKLCEFMKEKYDKCCGQTLDGPESKKGESVYACLKRERELLCIEMK